MKIVASNRTTRQNGEKRSDTELLSYFLGTPYAPTVRSRTNGNSNKWESAQKQACKFFANKWDFEQMGIWKVRTLTVAQNGKSFALLKVVVLFSFGLTTLLALKIHNVFSQLKTTYFQGWLISSPKSVQRCLLHCVCCPLPSDGSFSPAFTVFYHNTNSTLM